MEALYTEEERKELNKKYRDLLKNTYQTLSVADKKKIRQAFELAVEAHAPQRRKTTNEPYIYHPIAVAKIVADEIGLGGTSITAALLHDVVEDTDYTLDDIERLFGETVARIVDGLTKIAHVKKEKDVSMQAENFRKMLLTLHDDVRVILIKIADRLHNMQTMEGMPLKNQLKTSSETLFIYAPLAHRLGLYNIKEELEGLGLKYTEPEVYNDIKNKIEESKEEQEHYIASFKKIIDKALYDEGLNFEINGRLKSIYSIRRKIVKQNVSFEEVYDRFAIRIVYKSDRKNEKFLAWKIYSIVTDYFTPNPNRMRDWISQPRVTGYEALHVTVMGPDGKWVEVQIRSERMHEIAEKGYAAHHKYKNGTIEEEGLESWLNKLKESLESPDSSAVDFVEEVKLNLFSKEIYIFTPKGQLQSLPKGSTTLDFAFSVHSEVGFHCRGAKVNNKLVPLNHVLNSGDQVEIITSENQKPRSNWLNFVITARARKEIKNALKHETKAIAEEGKAILKRKLRHLKLNFDDKIINEMTSYFKLKTSLDLFYKFGINALDNTDLKKFVSSRSNTIVNFFRNKIRKNGTSPQTKADAIDIKYDQLVFGDNEEHLDYTMSKCCKPIPGDDVFAFTTINEGLKIHKKNCPNAINMQAKYAHRIMKATWIDSSQQEHRVSLKITGIDDMGLVNKITQVISEMQVDMKGLNFSTSPGIFTGEIILVVINLKRVNDIIKRLKSIKGIDKVVRLNK